MLENNRSFFRRHIGNSEQEQQKMLDQLGYKNIKDLIGNVCDTDEKKEEALEAIELALSSLNNFLSGMERVYC